jgi:poly-gamma-glutamate capsule biosynthesis protein CapA/YwtB (metallophosphatase superfamily)
LGLGHLQFEALITTARLSTNRNDFALVALLGCPGYASSKPAAPASPTWARSTATGCCGSGVRGGKVVLFPQPPAVGRAIDRAVDSRPDGPILRNPLGARMDHNAATRRLKHLAATAGIRMPRMHPHMLRHTFVTTMLDAGVSLRDVQIAARHADPRTTMCYDRAQEPRPPPQLHPRRLHGLRDATATRGLAEMRTSDHADADVAPRSAMPAPSTPTPCDYPLATSAAWLRIGRAGTARGGGGMAVWKRPVVVILAAAAGMCASVPSSQPPVVLSPPAASGAVASVPEPLSTGAQPLPEPARSPRTLSVAASGDVLLHSGLWRQAAQDAAAAGRSGYDFGPLFAAVKPVVADADVAICHLETPVGDPAGPFSGYPLFDVPPQVVPALQETGYDSCSTASNHSLDRGEAGIRRTLDALDAAGLAHSGTHRSAQEAMAPTILTVNGVRVAHLSYTFSFNGLHRPAGKDWLANALDPVAILDEAHRARQAGAEIVIASLHWGTEYSHHANTEQIALAQRLLASPDVDLILGHHAHVVQPAQRIGHKWVVYGMGNHVSWQSRPETTRDGLIVRMTFTEEDAGRWRVSAATASATWMDLGQPARLRLVTAALADPATPAAARTACQRSLQRTRAAIAALGAVDAGLVIS